MNFLAMQNANISLMPEEEELIVDDQESLSITTPEYEENFNGIMKLKRGPRRRIYAGKCFRGLHFHG